MTEDEVAPTSNLLESWRVYIQSLEARVASLQEENNFKSAEAERLQRIADEAESWRYTLRDGLERELIIARADNERLQEIVKDLCHHLARALALLQEQNQ